MIVVKMNVNNDHARHSLVYLIRQPPHAYQQGSVDKIPTYSSMYCVYS